MALPAPRDLPTITATWNPMTRRYRVALPGNLTLEAKDAYDVGELVKRLAPWSSIRFVDSTQQGPADGATPVASPLAPPAPNTAGVAPESEAEQRFAHGNR